MNKQDGTMKIIIKTKGITETIEVADVSELHHSHTFFYRRSSDYRDLFYEGLALRDAGLI